MKVLIYIVSYNCEKFIESVLDRIPESFWNKKDYDADVLIIDDESSDKSVEKALAYRKKTGRQITVMKNPKNLGYGGNQKLGYHYAIKENYDIVVLLHGDGQYAPEKLPEMVEPLISGEADVVLGSRMKTQGNALEGGMPLYKFVGNKILTTYQNLLLKSNLSEFHTGYRAYSTNFLKQVNYQYNMNDFAFDTDILIQAMDNDFRIKEIHVPCFYGEEISHVNGTYYAMEVSYATLCSRLQKIGLYYHPKFDSENLRSKRYVDKTSFSSSHQMIANIIEPNSVVLDLGCGVGHLARVLKEKNCTVYGVDIEEVNNDEKLFKKLFVEDLNATELKFKTNEKIDYIILADIIEHLNDPEAFLKKLRYRFVEDGSQIIITTPNVAFLSTRLSLLFGRWSYTKVGILDKNHSYLFTFASLKNMLKRQYYRVDDTKGIPVPMPLVFGDNIVSKIALGINKFFIILRKQLFAMQMLVVARFKGTEDVLLERAKQECEDK